MRTPTRWVLAVLTLALWAEPVPADTHRVHHLGRDIFVAGDDVSVNGVVEGDAMAAGGRVAVDASVGGDAVAAGGEVALRGSVKDDAYLAGGKVEIGANVTGGARVSGGDVRLLPGARVADGLTVAGGRIVIEGEVGSYALLMGGSIRIDGKIDGDVRVTGGELRIGPNAVIDGSVIYRGPQPAQVAPGATIRGPMRNIVYERERWQRTWLTIVATLALLWFIGWALVGSLLLGLFPRATRRVTHAARARPGRAILAGLLALLVIPPLIAVFIATLVGIPLGLLALMLYLALLPLGYLAGVATVGDWFLERRRTAAAPATRRRIGVFVLMLLLVSILTQVPFIGWLGGVLLWALGIGAILLTTSVPAAADGPNDRVVSSGTSVQ